MRKKLEYKAQFIYKFIYGEKQVELFKHELSKIEWNNIIRILNNPNTAYKSFFNIFFETYYKCFPKVRIKIKTKTSQNHWITKGVTKPSKNKKSFMNGFLKNALHRKNKNTKIIRIFTKQLKRKERNYTTKTNYLIVLDILKKHVML